MNETEYLQIVTTTETKADAQKIADALIEKNLAGCVQIIGPITSTFLWKEKVETSNEWLCLIKSKKDLYNKLEAEIKKIHSYETPEIIALPILCGSSEYLNWLSSTLKTL